MGIELPGWLTEPLSWITLEWPQADETKLFEAAQVWMNFGMAAIPVGTTSTSAAETVWTTNEGPQVDAFKNWWNDEDGPTQRLSEDAAAAMIIGAALMIFAAITLAMKIAWIAALIALAVQVAMAIAASFATFGAASASIPGFIAVCRQVCMKLLRRVIDDVIKKSIKELLEKARKLLKKLNIRRRGNGKGPDSGIPGPLRRTDLLRPTRLKDRYRGEADPNNPHRPFYPSTVRYMDDATREQHRLFVRDGKLYNAKDGTPFDTSQATTAHTAGGGRAMYVMDRNGNLYARNHQEVGVWHHSSFLRGDDVAGAGELDVRDGVVNVISRKSGHYMPTEEAQQQVLDELRRQGLDTSRIATESF